MRPTTKPHPEQRVPVLVRHDAARLEKTKAGGTQTVVATVPPFVGVVVVVVPVSVATRLNHTPPTVVLELRKLKGSRVARAQTLVQTGTV